MRHSFHSFARTLVGLTVLGLTALAWPSAQAASATAPFQVTATVLKACAMTTPSTLAFSSYLPSNPSALTNSTTFNITCTFGTTYSLGISAGAGTGATTTARKMTSPTGVTGSNTLNYGLYTDTGHTANWDNATTASGYTATGAAQAYTVYGSVSPGQYQAAPGTDYADTVTLTLTY